MHRSLLALVAALAVTAPPSLAQDPSAAGDDGCVAYGAGLGGAAVTSAVDILAAPDDWAGETVRVEGDVREVCPLAGCWLSIVAGDGEETLRVKVDDGEIFFPLSARGRRAIAEGVVEVHDMSRESWAAWVEHLAEERGEAFDPASVGDGPFRRVQVKATGAAVCTPAPRSADSDAPPA